MDKIDTSPEALLELADWVAGKALSLKDDSVVAALRAVAAEKDAWRELAQRLIAPAKVPNPCRGGPDNPCKGE